MCFLLGKIRFILACAATLFLSSHTAAVAQQTDFNDADIAEYRDVCRTQRLNNYGVLGPILLGENFSPARIDHYDEVKMEGLQVYTTLQGATAASFIDVFYHWRGLSLEKLAEISTYENNFGRGWGTLGRHLVCAGQVRVAQLQRSGADPRSKIAATLPAQPTVMRNAIPTGPTAAQLAAVSAYRSDLAAFRARYPGYAAWSDAQNRQYALFVGTNTAEILNKHKSAMAKDDVDALSPVISKLQAEAGAACPGCKAEYPGGPLPPNEPGSKMRESDRAARDFYDFERKNAPKDPGSEAIASTILFGLGTKPSPPAQPAKPRPVHNRANDATACIAVEPTGVQMEWGMEGRYRLRNTCSYPIDASWCANISECGGSRGSSWTISPGKDWPIYFADITNPFIQVGACKAGDAKQPPLGQQGVEHTGFNATRDQPAPAPGVSLLSSHRCD